MLRGDSNWFAVLRWFHLLFLSLIVQTSWASESILTIVDFNKWPFRAEVADFSDSLRDVPRVYTASLNIPPISYAQLCEFPESSLLDKNRSYAEYHTPQALLVSLGGCSISDKVLVALDIKKRVTKTLRGIIFYNNDPNNPDEIIPFKASDFDILQQNFDGLGLVSISTIDGVEILGRIEQLAVITGTNPEFLSHDNSQWHLPMVLERLTEETYDTGGVGGYNDPQNFYWFRFILFVLLITSPCCRAGYLWWAAGGRIRFRYNENGRIIGLQYIPPMPYWFANGGGHDGGSPITDRLSEDEVMALPEISYKPPPEEPQHDNSNSVITETETEAGKLEEIDVVVGSGSADSVEEMVKADDCDSPGLESPTCSADSDEEQPEDGSENYETTCTMCSICIDDFELGERIRLLPRCRHSFHTECILPWLTGRQGCCPLCKLSVLEPEGGEESNENQPTGEVSISGVDRDTGSIRLDREQAPGDVQSLGPMNNSSSDLPEGLVPIPVTEDKSTEIMIGETIDIGSAVRLEKGLESDPLEVSQDEHECPVLSADLSSLKGQVDSDTVPRVQLTIKSDC